METLSNAIRLAAIFGIALLILTLSSCQSSRLGCAGPQQNWVGCGGNK